VTRVDAPFAEVLRLLGELRSDGILGFRFDTQTGPRTAYLLLEAGEDQALDPRARRLLDLLGLDPSLRSFPIRFGFDDGRATEIQMYTRSLIEIIGNLAAQVQVPAGDVAAGRTYPTQLTPAELESLPTLSIRIARGATLGGLRRRRLSRHLVLDRRSGLRLEARVQRSDAALESHRQERRGAAAGDHDPDRLV
jgi:hypothetical protein